MKELIGCGDRCHQSSALWRHPRYFLQAVTMLSQSDRPEHKDSGSGSSPHDGPCHTRDHIADSYVHTLVPSISCNEQMWLMFSFLNHSGNYMHHFSKHLTILSSDYDVSMDSVRSSEKKNSGCLYNVIKSGVHKSWAPDHHGDWVSCGGA
jgi:hypothetical protein